ncbi:MAG: hypothetical protein IEMM0008_0853 [bacterium]|nr:MAG: hypothetical protein IEMM0008_0853 [bacterium]
MKRYFLILSIYVIFNPFLLKCSKPQNDLNSKLSMQVKLVVENKKLIDLRKKIFNLEIIDFKINAVIDKIVFISLTTISDQGKSWFKIAIDWKLKKSYLFMYVDTNKKFKMFQKHLELSSNKNIISIPTKFLFQDDILLTSDNLKKLYSVQSSIDKINILEKKLKNGIWISSHKCQIPFYYFPLIIDHKIAIIKKNINKIYLYDARKCSLVEFVDTKNLKLANALTDTIDQSIIIQSLLKKYYKSNIQLQKNNMIYSHGNVVCNGYNCFYIEYNVSEDINWRISKINLKTGKKEFIDKNGFQFK